MSIQDWGAIGELLSAIAVLGTLLYLSIQIRQTNLAMTRASRLGVAEAHARWRAAIYENPPLAELLEKDNNDEPLSGAEKIQIETLHLELFISCVLDVFTVEEGAPHAEYEYLMNILNANPSVRNQWEKQRELMIVMVPEVVVEIDRKLGENA